MKNVRQTGFLVIFIFLAGVFSLEAGQDNVRIRTQVDRRSIFIGDRIRLSISVSSEGSLVIEFPKFKDGLAGTFEVRDAGARSEKRFLAGYLYSHWYDITSFTVGKSTVPALEVKYRSSPAKNWEILKTEEIAVTVESVIPQKEKAKDIKDIKGPRSFFSVKFWTVASAVLFLLFFFLSVIVYRKIRRGASVRPAHVVALEALERIRSLFATTGDIREYYFMISDCVRTYIENALGIRAPEMTTEEFLASMDVARSLSDSEKNLLKEFLKTCDMVKFAKQVPSNVEVESVFETAKNFIARTSDEMAKREVIKSDARI